MITEQMNLIELAALSQKMIDAGYKYAFTEKYNGFKTIIFFSTNEDKKVEVHEEHKYPLEHFMHVSKLLAADKKNLVKNKAYRKISAEFITENISELKDINNETDNN